MVTWDFSPLSFFRFWPEGYELYLKTDILDALGSTRYILLLTVLSLTPRYVLPLYLIANFGSRAQDLMAGSWHFY